MLQRSDAKPVDVDRVWALSHRWRSEAVVSRAVGLAWEAFALPETTFSRWAWAYSPSERDQRALGTYLDTPMGYAARSYTALQSVQGVRVKAVFARALAFPDRNYGADRHSSRWQRSLSAGRQIVALRRRKG